MPLPEGVYFDGRRYVSFDGDSFDDHPCLADLLNAHVQQANADADVFNAQVVALERQLRAEAQVLLTIKEPPLPCCVIHHQEVIIQAQSR